MENKNEKKSIRESSSKKFNTELFNKPFSVNQINNSDVMINNSVISQQSDNDISFQNVSFQKSVNSSTSNINETSKKRKPFDNIQFNDNILDEVTNSITNSMRSGKELNLSESMPKSNAETEITSKKKFVNKKCDINSQICENENMNNTKTSELEKSTLIKTQSALDKDIVNKALKYNKASDKENCPFWVKFFIEENTRLKENSSYFKAKDKDQYIKTMIEITKNDAKLEEKTRDLKEKKDKTYNELKKLLLTEIKEENKFEEEKCQNVEQDSKISDKKDSIPQKIHNKNKNESITNAVNKYSDSNKKDNLFENNIDVNYYEYVKKQKILQESKTQNHIQKNIKNVGEKPLLNKYSHKKPVSLNQEEVYKNEDPYPGLDQLDIEKGNYENVAFRYYGKDVLKSLFDIDSKLEKLNPAYKNFSTKNDLKNIKETYSKNTNNKVQNKKISNDKFSKQKIKNDYQDQNADIRFKRELKSTLYDIDTKLLLAQRQEINREKIETFIENMNKNIYSDEREREKALEFKIPEEAVFDKMEHQFDDCDKMLKIIKLQIAEKEKNEIENLVKIKDPEEITKEDLENKKNLEILMKDLDEEQAKTQIFINGLDNVQQKISEEDKIIDTELDKLQALIRKNELEYDNIINKYEEEIENKYSKDDEEKDDYEGDKSPDYYYKLYGIEDIIHHNYQNDVDHMNKSFRNEKEKLEKIREEN